MAKGDVILKFDANTAAFIQAVDAARTKLLSTGDAVKHLSEHADKGAWSMHNLKDGAKELAIGLVGVTSAAGLLEKGVEVVGEVFNNYMERMTERAGDLLGKIKQLNSAMGDTGKTALTPIAREQAKEIGEMVIGGRMAGNKEATDMFSSVVRAVPNAKDAKASAVLGETARAGEMSEDKAKEAAILHARLMNGGMSAEDAATAALTAVSNEQSPVSLRSFFRAGGDKNALNLDVAATMVDEGQRKVDSILELTKGDPARLKSLLENPERAPRKDRAAVVSIAKAMKSIRTVTPESLAAAGQNLRATDNPTHLANLDHGADLIHESLLESGGEDALKNKAIGRVFRTTFEKDFPNLSLVPKLSSAVETISSMAMQISSLRDSVLGNTKATQENTKSDGGGETLHNSKPGQRE